MEAGRIVDVAIGVRKGSPTYGKWVSEELSEENKKMLWVPPGFAHGFITLEKSFVHYKVTKEYNKDSEGGVIWNDPLKDLAQIVMKHTGIKDGPEWYGDPDTRSYRASFAKALKVLNFTAEVTVEDGVKEIMGKIRDGVLEDTPESHTVEHYKKPLSAKDLLDRYGYSMNNRIL